MNKINGISERDSVASESHSNPLCVEVSATIIEAIFQGCDSAEIDAFDLYDAIIRDNKSKIASLTFVNDTYKNRAASHASAIQELEGKLLEATLSRDALAAELTNTAPVVNAVAMAEHQNACLALEGANSQLTNEVADLKQKLVALNELAEREREAFESAKAEILNASSLLENKLAAAEGRCKEIKKASDNSLRLQTQKNEKLARELEVSNAELVKLRQRGAESHKANLLTIEAMKRAKSIRDELTDELATLRTERRYLTMMMDCLFHENFFESEDGYASVLTFNTHKISSPDEQFVIDEAFAVGLWINKNGFSCVLGVSVADEEGKRSLVMPRNEKISKRAETAICPPSRDRDAILEGLMKFDAAACSASVARSRDVVGRLAIYGEHQENVLLENKNLIATTRNKAGGASVVPKKTGHSAKRKPKARR